jgi:hypothetical protein
MKHIVKSVAFLSFVIVLGSSGCARANRDTSGFAMEDTITVAHTMDDTWQATKSVLRDLKLDIYTRDTRGEFVAYTEMNRYLKLFTPKRTQLSVHLESISANSTKVSIETLHQVYGVTLLTYPDWHDRKTSDNKQAQAILDALKQKLG